MTSFPAGAPPPAPLAAFLGELAAVLARPAGRSRALARLCEALAALGGGPALLCTAAEDGVLRVEMGTGELAALEGDLVPVDGTLEGDAFAAREPRTTPNLRADARAFLPVHRSLPNTPAVALPLVADGRCLGVALVARPPRAPELAAGEMETLVLAAAMVASALANLDEVERVRASRAVVESWRQSRGRDAALSRSLLRAVRHELNTPVAVIRGHLQLCPSEDPAEWKVPPAELWRAIRAEAARLEGLSKLLHHLDEAGAAVALDAQGRFVTPLHGNGATDPANPVIPKEPVR